MHALSGNIVDVLAGTVFHGPVYVEDGRIEAIERDGPERPEEPYLVPGLVDAHVHVESSLLVPSEFARLAVRHGTVATVSDPHEIGNVLGVEGVEYMIENGRRVPLKFHFGAPSCVPATPFETAGAEIDVRDVEQLLDRHDVRYLSEMMNVPGAIEGDPDVRAKIESALERGKPVDGHAPGLRGEKLQAYVEAGITTDHESFTESEAREKIEQGLRIAIREGSAARDFDELAGLIDEFPDRCMLCTDDMHPDRLLEGHVDALVRRALARGSDPMKVLRCATRNPVRHYDLPVGLLQEGDPADLLIVDGIRGAEEFRVRKTFVDGRQVAEDGRALVESVEARVVNRFDAEPVEPGDLRVVLPDTNGSDSPPGLRVIRAEAGRLVTEEEILEPTVEDGAIVPDPERDLAELTVLDRYRSTEPALAFVRGFGLDEGALASSVAHDSHNVVAVGTDRPALAAAANAVIEQRGGLALATAGGRTTDVLPLPVAGLMTDRDGFEVARRYAELDRRAKEELGSGLEAPFMTLSFMALLVIPDLKLSDRGLFDGRSFEFVSLTVDG